MVEIKRDINGFPELQKPDVKLAGVRWLELAKDQTAILNRIKDSILMTDEQAEVYLAEMLSRNDLTSDELPWYTEDVKRHVKHKRGTDAQLWTDVDAGLKGVHLGVDFCEKGTEGCYTLGNKFCVAIAVKQQLDSPEFKRNCQTYANDTIDAICRELGFAVDDVQFPDTFNLHPPIYFWSATPVTVPLDVAEQLLNEYYVKQMKLIRECRAKLESET